MSGGDEFTDNGGADKSGRAGYKDTHEETLQLVEGLCQRVLYPGKVVKLYGYND
jgi:hypothetical protein